jgi:hypothetical protein
MPEPLNNRVTRLEKTVERLAAIQEKDHNDLVMLRKVVGIIAEDVGREVTALGKEVRQYARESQEREKRADQRIEKLVSAMGEFIRRRNGK